MANNQCISMKTFIALCIASNINIMFIENRKCFEIIFDSDETVPTYVVHCFKNFSMSTYCYETDVSQNNIEDYRNNMFKWESVDKPLKAVSYYKLEELIDICKRFDIIGAIKNKTKKELYELIVTKL